MFHPGHFIHFVAGASPALLCSRCLISEFEHWHVIFCLSAEYLYASICCVSVRSVMALQVPMWNCKLQYLQFLDKQRQLFCLRYNREAPFWDHPSIQRNYDVRTQSENIKIAAPRSPTEVKGGKWLRPAEHQGLCLKGLQGLLTWALISIWNFHMDFHEFPWIASICGFICFMCQTALGYFHVTRQVLPGCGSLPRQLLSFRWVKRREAAKKLEPLELSWTVLIETSWTVLKHAWIRGNCLNQRLSERPFCNPHDTISPPESSKLKNLGSWDHDGTKSWLIR